MSRRLIAAAAASCVLISALGNPSVFAETAPGDISSETVLLSSGSGDYAEYISKYNNQTEHSQTEVLKTVNSEISSEEITFEIEVLNSGLYSPILKYKALDEGTSEFLISMKIDGAYPFEEARQLSFPRFWKTGDIRVDGLGNEFSPEASAADMLMESAASDSSGWSADEYKLWLDAGTHSVSLSAADGVMQLEQLRLVSAACTPYGGKTDGKSNYSGNQIVIEGENPYLLSSYWLIPKSDNTSASVTPPSNSANKVNYIGGGNWKTAGETIYWRFSAENDGYYQIGFTYRQSAVMNGSVYRNLKIDGVCPFEQARQIPFRYSTKWQNTVFSSDENEPYLIYLSAGEHILSLTATPGPIAEISRNLKDAVSDLGSLYMDITMITGETVDSYRDYELFSSVQNMESRVKRCFDNLSKASEDLSSLGKQGSGSYDSTIKAMMQILGKMLDNKYTAHRYVSDYYSTYCSIASTLNEMRDMPLDLDRIILASPEKQIKFNSAGALRQFGFSAVKFLKSFIGNYNNISGVSDAEEHLTIWVNWGRDQAQILNALIQSDFTPEYSMPVNVRVTNATIVQSVLSGNQPDIILQQPRSEPVNLAIRGVLLDLNEFDDIGEVLARFHSGAEIPYKYKDGLYGLPDTQTFNLMFYRTDVFERLGLSVPKTWDEFATVCRLLSRNNLQVWLPYTQITNTTQVNTGVGSLTLFPCLLLQNGLGLYSEDGRASTLSNADVIKVFEYWTDFYTKMKLPITMNFYNRFRTGTCPLGISQYTTYTTLKAAAPEIDGLWSVTSIPGMKREDGTVNSSSSGGGTGCCILKSTNYKSAAWNFLKWWTSADIQFKYTNNLESVLGPTGRVAVSNAQALEKISWDRNMKSDIIEAWNNVQEVPEVPGSYYASRAIDLSFWSVVNENSVPKDVLLRRSAEVDTEIERKWKQYENR